MLGRPLKRRKRLPLPGKQLRLRGGTSLLLLLRKSDWLSLGRRELHSLPQRRRLLRKPRRGSVLSVRRELQLGRRLLLLRERPKLKLPLPPRRRPLLMPPKRRRLKKLRKRPLLLLRRRQLRRRPLRKRLLPPSRPERNAIAIALRRVPSRRGLKTRRRLRLPRLLPRRRLLLPRLQLRRRRPPLLQRRRSLPRRQRQRRS